MVTDVRVPVRGEGMESALIADWYVGEGDSVDEGSPLFSIETAKAVYDVPAPASGIVSRISARAGDEVEVHQVVAVIGDGADEATAGVVSSPSPIAESDSGARVAASPRARLFAQSHGIDVAEVAGTGPGGRVIVRDVQRHRAAQHREPVAVTPGPAAATEPIAPPPSASPVPVPLRGIRAVTAARMTEAAAIPTVTLQRTADARRLGRTVARAREAAPRWDLPKIGVNDVICLVVARALRRHPDLNAHFVERGIIQHDGVHLGIAVATDHGLVVPVVRDADRLGLAGFAGAVRDLVDRARARRLGQDDLTGGTFTVTNLGAYGVAHFSPLLNPPEVGILGVGAIAPGVVPDGTVADTIALSLTFDHRALDGTTAAEFLRDVADGLADVDVLLGA